MQKLSVFLAFVLLACSDNIEAPTAPDVSSAPAGKVAEAWGFDFRIHIAPNLTDRVPIYYLSQIRKAAQTWESIIWSVEAVEHYAMPDASFNLIVTDSWRLDGIQPDYLGWTDMEIVVFVDDNMTPLPEHHAQPYAEISYWTIGDSWPQTYLPIVAFKIAPYTAQQIAKGNLALNDFYRIALHELGHALGIGGTVLATHGKVRQTEDACSYIGSMGVEAFSIIRGKRYAGVPMTPDCNHWNFSSLDWFGTTDIMFPRLIRSDIPRDRLISAATFGVLDDLGYVMDYYQAPGVEVVTATVAGKETIERHAHGSPSLMPAESIELIQPSNEGF